MPRQYSILLVVLCLLLATGEHLPTVVPVPVPPGSPIGSFATPAGL